MKQTIFKNHFKLFRIGFVLSFSGSLAPGVITMGVLQLTLARGYFQGILFSLGAVGIEMLLLWIIGYLVHVFYQNKRMVRILQGLSLLLLVILTFGAGFYLTRNPADAAFIPVLHWSVPALAGGMLLRLLTPTFIPFWMGWTVALRTLKVLQSGRLMGAVYAVSAGLGTFAAHGLFIILAWSGAQYLHNVHTIANWLTFIILLVSVGITANKLWHLRHDRGPVNSFE